MKITIISGTNRPGSNTLKVAKIYQNVLKEKGIETDFLSLEEHDITHANTNFAALQEEYLVPAEKYIIIMPEYNGSFPGILKLLIDKSDVKRAWWHKKVLLTGVSTGRAGNLRGMEHLSGSLLHMKMLVHPNRLPLSTVDRILDEENKITDELTLKTIGIQLDEFLAF